ncbi:hypothetical protein AAVH_37539 [Aphelenchoides avenae]|nr:hypothetical protein AAVH_37539 [Aphelenchus avenae]
MLLPNELLLQVLRFADYTTLVLAKLARARFLHIVACRRRFRVDFYGTGVAYIDTTSTVGAGGNIRYKPGNQASLAAAFRNLAGVIGPHAVVELKFVWDKWLCPASASSSTLSLRSSMPKTYCKLGILPALLKDSGCELAFRMRTYEGEELVLDESEYAVDVDDTTTSYTSEESGIVVKFEDDYIVIRSTGDVPPAKRSRRNE